MGKKGSYYDPETAWARIKSENTARWLEEKYPTKWWHDIVFGWTGAIVLLTFAVSLFFLLFALVRLF